MPRTTDRIALVTGANKGIGFEVARGIAKAGFVVLLGARNPTTGRDAADTQEGARRSVRVALQERGPSGKFLETGGELVW